MHTKQPGLTSTNLTFAPRSLALHADVEYGLARTEAGPRLAVLAPNESAAPSAFAGYRSELAGQTLTLCPLTPANAAALRAQLIWLLPHPLGLATSAGLGDRLGLATRAPSAPRMGRSRPSSPSNPSAR